MITTFYRFLLLSIMVFALSFAGQAYGQDKRDEKIDKAQAAQKAQQQVKGRVLKVEQNKTKYKVKVLQKSGRVVTVDVDKNSGRVTDKRDKDK